MNLKLPPLLKFHYYLCSLNYYKDFNDKLLNIEADNQNIDQTNDISNIKPLPLEYDSYEEYIKSWEKLFFIESKAQIIRSKTLESEIPEKFYLKEVERDDLNYESFKFLRKQKSEIVYATNDIVLISSKEPNEPHDEHIVGIVEYSSINEIKIKTSVNPDIIDERIKKILLIRTKDSEWFIQKLCNIVTLNREYQALQGIYNLSLGDIILSPKEKMPDRFEYFDIPETLKQALKVNYNESQYTAIKESLKKEGITLIQGPPGTGKTTTILGIMSVLLNSYNKVRASIKAKDIVDLNSIQPAHNFTDNEKKSCYMKAMPWLFQSSFEDWRDERQTYGEKVERVINMPKRLEETTKKPEKILICGPSNASIDEIVRIIRTKGLFNEDGKRYVPFLVRIGPNVHHTLKEVSLEYMLTREKEARNLKGDDDERLRNEILNKAQIICSTLSVTGSSLLISYGQRFDTVVIDEAAQAVEISTLIPLKYDCKRLILIGDPKQLPATIFSKITENNNYDRSIFQRFQMLEYPVHLLNTQYRMNPIISKLVSSSFYDAKLHDYEKIMDLIGKPALYANSVFNPISFFNIKGQEIMKESSYVNEIEANVVVQLYRYLKKISSDFDIKKLGIISPYSGQVGYIKELIRTMDKTLISEVEVNTVDGFQGREKDIIIFSTVRSQYDSNNKNKPRTIGFLRDERRMNVSLSRARLCLIVVGDLNRLMYSPNNGRWKKLIKYTWKNNRCFNVEEPYDTYFDNFQSNIQKYKVELYKNKPRKSGDAMEKNNKKEEKMEVES